MAIYTLWNWYFTLCIECQHSLYGNIYTVKLVLYLVHRVSAQPLWQYIHCVVRTVSAQPVWQYIHCETGTLPCAQSVSTASVAIYTLCCAYSVSTACMAIYTLWNWYFTLCTECQHSLCGNIYSVLCVQCQHSLYGNIYTVKLVLYLVHRVSAQPLWQYIHCVVRTVSAQPVWQYIHCETGTLPCAQSVSTASMAIYTLWNWYFTLCIESHRSLYGNIYTVKLVLYLVHRESPQPVWQYIHCETGTLSCA